jgi:DNA-binding MarR family transcriptional regulator
MKTRLGVTGQQRLVLRIVERFPDISAGDLARVTWLHPSTLTGGIRRLERRGLLERVADARDRRRVKLRVRPRARRLAVAEAGTVEEAVAKMLTSLPNSYVLHVRRVLTTLAATLDERIVADNGWPVALRR